MADEWGPWIEHNGKGCPVHGLIAQWQFDEATLHAAGARDSFGVVCLDARTFEGRARKAASWMWMAGYYRIIRYRVRKPRALLDLIRLVEALPDPVPREVVPA